MVEMGKVTVFVDRLWTLVHSVDFEIGSWSPSGDEFEVYRKNDFESAISDNFTCTLKTFKRQLYFYGFKTSDYRGKIWKFSHENFKRGCPQLLCKVKRRQVTSAGPKSKKRKLPQILTNCNLKDVGEIRGRTECLPNWVDDRKASAMNMIDEMKKRLARDFDDLKRNVCTPPQLCISDNDFVLDTILCDVDDAELDTAQCFAFDPPLVRVPMTHNSNIYVRIYNKRLKFGEKLAAQFFNRFVTVAEKFLTFDSITLAKRLTHEYDAVDAEYSLLKLKQYMNPMVAAILSDTIEADKNVHKNVIQLAHESEFSKPDDEILFEYHFVGGIFAIYMEPFSTFMTHIVSAVHDSSGISMQMRKTPTCAFVRMMESYLTEKTKLYLAASQFFFSPKAKERMRQAEIQIGKLNNVRGTEAAPSITIYSE